MTQALVAYHDSTYGGVYYSNDIDFTNTAVQPTWTKRSATGLANNLVKVMQTDYIDPYGKTYIQLDNDDCYLWNGSSWDKIMDLAAARTLVGLPAANMGFIATNKSVAGRVYIPIGDGLGYSGTTKVLISTDYGASWTQSTVRIYNGTTGAPYCSAEGDHIWVCGAHLYAGALHYSGDHGASWDGLYSSWGVGSGGQQINAHSLDGNYCYFAEPPGIGFDLRRYTHGPYGYVELQSGKNIGGIYTATLTGGSEWRTGNHWFDPFDVDHQIIVIGSSSTGDTFMYVTYDSWATIVEGTPTTWTIAAGISSIDAARENDDYILMAGGRTANPDEPRVWAKNGETTSVVPWHVSGTNHATSPYTDAIPSISGAHISNYGVFSGESPASPGVYVYADEQGDITSLPTYTGLGIPLFGDRSAWRDMPADGYDIYHAQDVQAVTPQIHAPWDDANPPAAGYGIVSDGAKWIVSTDEIALVSDVHDAITLDADAAVLLDLQGAGGQEIGLDTQTANYVFAGPATGAANEPTFRAIVAADLASGADVNKYLRGDMVWASLSSAVLDYIHEHAINEDLSSLCDGSKTVFILANEYMPETTAFYLNGVRQLLITDYTEDAGYDQVTFTTAPVAGDILTADYILAGAI